MKRLYCLHCTLSENNNNNNLYDVNYIYIPHSLHFANGPGTKKSQVRKGNKTDTKLKQLKNSNDTLPVLIRKNENAIRMTDF